MATEIPFSREFALQYGVAESCRPLVRRVVARNASPFTFKGTGTYIIGHGKVAVIDPGPDLAEHVDALLDALRGETVTHILITHTHLDHSPAAAAVKRATGAQDLRLWPPRLGPRRGPQPASAARPRKAATTISCPMSTMREGDTVDRAGLAPRRGRDAGPHLEPSLLCARRGEHAVLRRPRHGLVHQRHRAARRRHGAPTCARSGSCCTREDALYRPTHGPAIADPRPFVAAFIAHRNERQRAIFGAACRRRRHHRGDRARGLSSGSTRASSPRPGARCWRISWRWSRKAASRRRPAPARRALSH